MTYIVTKYRCSLCHAEYGDPVRAENCEALGRPEPRYKIGDQIDYGTEDGGFGGGHWCYGGASGKVVGRRMIWAVESGGKKIHTWVYAVQAEEGYESYIGTVGVIDGPAGLQSTVEMRPITMGPEFEVA